MTTGTTLVECRSDTHLTLPVVDRGGRGYCFNCVVEDYQSHAFNLALRVTGDSGLAGDGVQEALLSAYRGFGSFRGDNLRAWLLRIVANACRDILKSRRVRPSVSLDAMIIDPEDPSSPDPGITVYRGVARRLRR